ncbi:alpha-ketoglutarate-dependent dioxygenase AlkB [Chryseobacterium sp. Mn2064]|uniref:alpha-ketoglutarate-dependent dioxygenase AlkB n=1 Tax=Chryseobacterium sp. Mn2064 TaxID=3395263 RepID=UPI003BC2EA1B
MNDTEFKKILLPLEENLFTRLSLSAEFESTGKGRLGTHLVNVADLLVPIVRTTTRYTIPATAFSEIHHQLVDRINESLSSENSEIPTQNFNNALIEIYDSSYAKMGFHSDQALDLKNDSFIGLFSCYDRPDEIEDSQMRKLVVKNKTTDEEFEILLHHNSVVLFSVEDNKKFQHKIILNSASSSRKVENDNKWLGITFRTSKTYIKFQDEKPYFSTGEVLTIADQEQEAAFFKLRGEENRSLDFVYPNVLYTISQADILPPTHK